MSSTSRKKIILGALIVFSALCVGTAVRGELRRNTPEPEHCVLCDSGYTCHAPALLNLATGEVAELEVYAFDPRLPDEIDKNRTGFMRLSYGAGVQVCMDAGRSASRWLRACSSRARQTGTDQLRALLPELPCATGSSGGKRLRAA